MTIGLILTAAGSGSRFLSDKPKLLETIQGLTILEHSLLAFKTIKSISSCVVTCPKEYLDEYDSLLKKHSFPFPVTCIFGDSTRGGSVKKAFETLEKTDVVLIHDAARPCVTTSLIERVIESLNINKVVIPGLPVTDTIKRLEHNVVTETVDRSRLVSVQTPQGFHRDTLDTLYFNAAVLEITDESILAENEGVSVLIVDGEKRNIKLTYPEDLELISFYL